MHRATNASAMGVPRADPVALTRALTRIDSRNPLLVPGAPGEAAIAQYLGDILVDWGFSVELNDADEADPISSRAWSAYLLHDFRDSRVVVLKG